jgi:hypothetical protein
MSRTWVFLAERVVNATALELQRSRWLSMLGGTAAAYLFYFYAGVYLELNQPPALIVFIG